MPRGEGVLEVPDGDDEADELPEGDDQRHGERGTLCGQDEHSPNANISGAAESRPKGQLTVY